MVITQIISVPNGTRSRYTEHLASIASTTGRIASYNATMTLILLGFCNFMTPQKPFKGQVPCTPIAEDCAYKTTKVTTRKSVVFSFTLTGADLASIRVQAVMLELVHDKHTKTQKSET